MNDLYHIKHIFNVKLKMYADDTVIYAHGNSVPEVQQNLQLCLDYVYDWCILNRLYMNMKKKKIMWLENNTQSNIVNTNYLVSVNNVLLSRVYSYLYLGVEYDHTLSYDKHLENVVNKTTPKLYIFRKIRRFISKPTAILVYKHMILQLLEYCNILFNSGKKLKIDKLTKYKLNA